jgi:hypothetical protein
MNSNRRKIRALLASAIVIVSSISVAAQQPARASIDNANTRPAQLPNPYRSIGTISTPAPSRSTTRPTARQRTPLTEADLLSGVNLSEQQKAAIDQIHHQMRAKMQIVARDENESPEQKSAMLEGMSRMQLRQVFDVLKPEQREDVRKKIQAARSATHQEGKTPSEQKAH